jgi:hypothetical protein
MSSKPFFRRQVPFLSFETALHQQQIMSAADAAIGY